MIRLGLAGLVALSLWVGGINQPAQSGLVGLTGLPQPVTEVVATAAAEDEWIDPPPPPKPQPQPDPSPQSSPDKPSPQVPQQPTMVGEPAAEPPPAPPQQLPPVVATPKPAPQVRLLRTPLRPYRTLPSSRAMSDSSWRTPLRPG